MLFELMGEWDVDLRSTDPLDFPGYGDRAAALDHESVRTGTAAVNGVEAVVVECDFDVFGGSMGLVHGEKVVRAVDRAIEARSPVVVVARSGGARMQEGMVALAQMARTAAAVQRHHDAGLLSVAVLRSPTTGGVFASYGSLCDLTIAEANATVGFAGPRVVEQTTGIDVTGRSHTADTAFAAGLVDAVVPTGELVAWVAAALGGIATPLVVEGPPRDDDDDLDGGDDPGSDASDLDPAWRAVLAARLPCRGGRGVQQMCIRDSAWRGGSWSSSA